MVGLKTLMNIPPVLNAESNFHIRKSTDASMFPYLQEIGTSIAHMLTTLDNHFGSWLLSNQTKPMSGIFHRLVHKHVLKFYIELLSKSIYGPQGLDLLKTCLDCIPFVYLSIVGDGSSQPDILNILARYLIHMDDTIRAAASDALTRLLSARPTTRYSIISSLCNFVLSNPDFPHVVISTVLHKVSPLLLICLIYLYKLR
jgi:hypothetical protein